MRVMMFARSGIAAAMLVIAATPATPQASGDLSIIGGRRIGPVVLGMSEADVLKVLGEPNNTESSRDGEAHKYSWPDWTVRFVPARARGAYEICTTSSRFATLSGVHVGSSTLTLLAAYPRPLKKQLVGRGMWYKVEGPVYVFTDGGGQIYQLCI